MTASWAGVGSASPVFSTVTIAAISATVGPVLAGRNVTFRAWSALRVPSVARSVGANAKSSPSVPLRERRLRLRGGHERIDQVGTLIGVVQLRESRARRVSAIDRSV